MTTKELENGKGAGFPLSDGLGSGQTCQTCRWHDVDGLYKFYGKNADGMGDFGFCRRFPPRVGRNKLEDDESLSRFDYFLFSDWPETVEEEWCGEWKPTA